MRTLAARCEVPSRLDPETIEQRLEQELRAADAVALLLVLVGAWGRRPHP